MSDRHTLIPGGQYLNDIDEATLYQRQIPGSYYVNETSQTAAGVVGPKTWIAPPQQSHARELVGYAAIFGAVAALLAPLPQKAIAHTLTVETHQAIRSSQPIGKVWGTNPALMPVAAAPTIGRPILVPPQTYTDLAAYVHKATPVGDTIGSAAYRFGAHQADVYASHPQPQVWGTAVPAVVVEPFIGRPVTTVPQQTDAAYAILWGLQPEGIDKPPPKTTVSAPEQFGISYAKLWGPVPAGIDKPPAKTLVSAPQESFQGYGDSWGPTPSGIDVPQPKTLVVEPEQQDPSYAKVWGPRPPDIKQPGTLYAAQEHARNEYGLVWGPVPEPIVVLDAPIGHTLVIPPQQDVPSYALLWGKQPDGIDVKPPTTQVSAPEQLGISYGKVWGTPVAAVVAAEFIGRPIVAAPLQTDQAYALVWGPFTVSVPATDTPVGHFRFSYREEDLDRVSGYVLLRGVIPDNVIIQPPGVEWIIRARRRKGRG